MFNKRKKIIITKLLIILLSLILMFILISRTFSKYETNATSQADIQAAFYLLNEDYQTMTINLGVLEPRTGEYSYTFSISNNDGEKRTETSLEYDLTIVTTTNLPLAYKLYMLSQDGSADGTTNIIINNEITQDEYGTYFRTITTGTERFGHQDNETNVYTLVINFTE